jgi:hypothetical protein
VADKPQTTTREVEDNDAIHFGRVKIETVITEDEFHELKNWLRAHRKCGNSDTEFKPPRLVMEWEELYEIRI